LSRFSKNRELFFELNSNRDKVEQLLLEGALKARKQAQNVLKRVRARVGF
jgi:soluble cytochrome b562